jgi:undecaprenyl-diphosphatase
MTLWFAALLGLIQGLTEFIPVSSNAHLRVTSALFGRIDDGAAYTAVLQLGTLAAVLVYYAKDLVAMPGAMVRDWSSPEGRLPWLIALGTVPIVIAGLVLRKYVEHPARAALAAAALVVAGSRWL